jgi:hypothetical protein
VFLQTRVRVKSFEDKFGQGKPRTIQHGRGRAAEILAAADAFETAGDLIWLEKLRSESENHSALDRTLADIALECREYAQALRYREIVFRTLVPDDSVSDARSLELFLDDVLALATSYGDAGLDVVCGSLLERLEGIVVDTFRADANNNKKKLISFYQNVGNWEASREIWN